ncbi:uncharacterized protein LOC113558004 [Rhopalosiphum maidis]|uniref:uncharacterized protein LOC113558004 n=1 Tax=Rhopalosiphum maidis TaxID=43146 RepID=UPI000EFE1A4E|nr:uncharacterized protein LOC113558004 [Rhopalosiphum maidis]
MTLFLSFFFLLSFNVIIFNLPSSQGNSSGYYQSTLSQVLTPSERLTYIIFGTLPNRIYYSYSKGSYVVRGQPGGYKNDLRRQRGKDREGYKVMPRWKYYLSKLSPVSLIKSGMQYASMAKALLGFGRGFKDFDDSMGNMGDLENPDDDPNNDEDSDLEDDAIDDANNDENGGNNNEKGSSGMVSSLPTLPTDLLSPLYDVSNDNKKEDDKDDDSVGYSKMAKNALQSDTAKNLVKTGISLLVPGGPAIVAAMDASSKLGGATDAIGKVPKLK